MVLLGIYWNLDPLMGGRTWLKLSPGEMGRIDKELLQFILCNKFLHGTRFVSLTVSFFPKLHWQKFTLCDLRKYLLWCPPLLFSYFKAKIRKFCLPDILCPVVSEKRGSEAQWLNSYSVWSIVAKVKIETRNWNSEISVVVLWKTALKKFWKLENCAPPPAPQCIRSSTIYSFRNELCSLVSAVTVWNYWCLPWSYTFIGRNTEGGQQKICYKNILLFQTFSHIIAPILMV